MVDGIVSIVRDKRTKCASGSVVEYRLAKARVAGSNPVSRLIDQLFYIADGFGRKHLMREWLSGGVSPCQGEGRGFESRLALFLCPETECRGGSGLNAVRDIHMKKGRWIPV